MSIGIIVLSSCGLSKQQANDRGYGFIPLTVNRNTDEYQEGVNISYDQTLEMVRNGDVLMTSMPSRYQMEEEMKRCLKKYDKLFVVSVSSGLSGSYNSLVEVAKMFDNDIHVIDTKSSLAVEIGLAEEIEEKIEEGFTFDAIKLHIEERTSSYGTYIVCKDLKSLVRTGRITKTAAKFAGMLKIKPVLTVKGKPELLKKTRGTIKAIKAIIEEMKENKVVKIWLARFGYENEVLKARELLESEFDIEITDVQVPAAVVSHTGEGLSIIAKYL